MKMLNSLACFLVMNLVLLSQSSVAQDEGEFGNEWPKLEDCLMAGNWTLGNNRYRITFKKDNRCVVEHDESFVDTFGRTRRTLATHLGEWKLEYRTITSHEKKRFGVDRDFKMYSLALDLKLPKLKPKLTNLDEFKAPTRDTENDNDPVRKPSETDRYKQISTKRKGKIYLALDLINGYDRNGMQKFDRSGIQLSGVVTNRKHLNWAVAEDSFGFVEVIDPPVGPKSSTKFSFRDTYTDKNGLTVYRPGVRVLTMRHAR